MEEDPATAYERLRDDYYEGMNSFEAVEGDKENVLPRRQGRRVSDLDAAYNSDQHEREQQRKQGHEAFLQEIESIDDLDDPLDVYIRYIHWTEANYPQGHNQESDLRGLLEETTGRFEKHTQYKNDARYLRCWIQYIQYADQPKQIYRDLMNKGIGQDLALFYETYADYLERCGEMDEASKVYKIGMEREAQPLNRLRRHQDAFENRRTMRESLARSTDDPRSRMRAPNRVMLGVRLDARSSFSSTPRRLGVSPGIANSVSSVITPARQFSVFTGPESSSSTSTTTSPSSPSSSNNAVVPNNTSSAIISNRIENQMPVDKFAGSTLSQKDYIRPPPSQFQVYRDQSSDQSGHSHRTYQNSQQELVDRFQRNKHIYIHSSSSGGKHEVVAANQECIRDGVVTSFEELRAHMQSQRRRMAKGKQKQVEEDDDVGESSEFHYTDNNVGHPPQDITIELTEETRAALRTINSLMSKNKDMSIDEDDESEMWTRSNKRLRRHVNENEDGSNHHHHHHPAIVPVKKYGHDANRIPFMDVCPTTPPPSSPFFNDAEGGHLEDDEDDEDDDFKEMQRMQREVQEAEQRKRQRLD